MHTQPAGTPGPRTKREGKISGEVPPRLGALVPGRGKVGWGARALTPHLRLVGLRCRRRHRHWNLQKGRTPGRGTYSPRPSRAPRWGCVETRECAARRQPTRHPGKSRPTASRGPPGSAARASGLLPRVLAASASGQKTLQPSRPRRCALRPSPAWPDTGSQVTVPGAGSPISRALIGP